MKDVLMWILIKLTYVHVWIIILAVIFTIAMIYFMIRPPKAFFVCTDLIYGYN
jgi:hypothetical protein